MDILDKVMYNYFKRKGYLHKMLNGLNFADVA